MYMTWFYNLIIGLGGIIIGMLTFSDEIANKIPLVNFLKSLIIKIPFFLLASFFIIWATIQKDNDNESLAESQRINHAKEIKNMDSTYRAEKKVSDSLNEKRLTEIIDSSYQKSIKASNEALAKYNLVLIDSLHHVANSINIKTYEPQLTVASAGAGVIPMRLSVRDGINYLDVKFMSANATSYQIKIAWYVLKNEDTIILLDHGKTFPGEKFIVPGVNSTVSFPLSESTAKENVVYVILLGEFSKDRDGKNKIPYRQA